MMTKYVVAYTVTWGGGCCCSRFKGEQTEAQTGEQTLQGTERDVSPSQTLRGKKKGRQERNGHGGQRWPQTEPLTLIR